MNLDDGAVEADRLDLDPDQLLLLQFLGQPVQQIGLGPAVHAGGDRVLVAEALGQRPPLAAVLCGIQDGVDDGEVAERDVATLDRLDRLDRQERVDAIELLNGNFDAAKLNG